MDVLVFMEGVAARIDSSRDPSHGDLSPYEAWSAAIGAVRQAIADEIDFRRKEMSINDNKEP